jgi:hypothetical protein
MNAAPAGELVYPSVLGMKSMRVLLCVVVLVSVATVTVVAPLQAAETSTTSTTSTTSSSTTSTIVVSPSVSSQRFTWSQRTLTVGTTLKASKLVSSKIKGTRTYRATGACSVRNGVLRFTRTGKCRVSVSVKVKNTGKVLRSSKLFTVKAKKSLVTGTPSEILDKLRNDITAFERKILDSGNFGLYGEIGPLRKKYAGVATLSYKSGGTEHYYTGTSSDLTRIWDVEFIDAELVLVER